MRLDVRSNLDAVKFDLARLKSNIRDRAIARAINRTAEQARTQMIRGITSEFAIQAKDVREQIKLRKAKDGSFGLLLTAELTAFGRRRGRRSRNVMLFGTRQTAKGVTVRIRKATGRRLIAGAFIGNKGRTVFKRVGAERLPIKGVETIDVPQMFNTKRINSKVVAIPQDKFPEILRREVSFYVERFGR